VVRYPCTGQEAFIDVSGARAKSERKKGSKHRAYERQAREALSPASTSLPLKSGGQLEASRCSQE
jgi:hypothetical protein